MIVHQYRTTIFLPGRNSRLLLYMRTWYLMVYADCNAGEHEGCGSADTRSDAAALLHSSTLVPYHRLTP